MAGKLITGCRHFAWAEAADREGHFMPVGVQVAVEEFGQALEDVRRAVGFPLIITSWYRDPKHSVEAAKAKPGVHSTGFAADIRCCHLQAYQVVEAAVKLGFHGIGLDQAPGTPPERRYIHLDLGGRAGWGPRPRVWSY